MRLAEIEGSWARLKKANSGRQTEVTRLCDDIELDLSKPCVVLGGRNGVGKSRLLRSVLADSPSNRVLINLHHLAEQALMILRSREDLDDMAEEYTPLILSDKTIDILKLTIGRDYESVDWFALEIEPSDTNVATEFSWAGDQPVVPYFRVTHRGRQYPGTEMGHGEFCVHFLFWILEQYRDTSDLVILLDEPDAHLPPIGVRNFLMCIIDYCLRSEWRLIIATHSEEMIRLARQEDAFTLLRLDTSGKTVANHVSTDPRWGDLLIPNPPVRTIFFCEDESAWHLTKALLTAVDDSLVRSVSIVWGNGEGYLRAMRIAVPRPPQPDIKIVLVFDGDQRADTITANDKRWPTVFLPTSLDPDSLLKGLAAASDSVAKYLSTDTVTLDQLLDSIEGLDPHDWINSMGEEFGREFTLKQLSSLWCETHPEEVEKFAASLIGHW